MRLDIPSDWHTIEDASLVRVGRLRIYAPNPDPALIDLARELWSGNYEGLERVREHHWGGHVYRVTNPIGGGTAYYKRFSIRNPRYLHKPKHARRTACLALRLEALGFKVPPTLCLLEHTLGGIVIDSAVIFEGFEGVVPLNKLINDPLFGYADDVFRRRALIRAAAVEIARWHNAGAYHGDLHTTNIFAHPFGRELIFHWIDLEEGDILDPLPQRRRVDDLYHLNRFRHRLPLTDRMRFWETYANEARIPREARKALMRKVVRKSQAYWLKKGWPLSIQSPGAGSD